MSAAFDDFRRSTAVLCLTLMRQQGLVTDEELMDLRPEVQRAMDLDWL